MRMMSSWSGKSGEFTGNLVWFSLDENNPVITEHVGNGGLAFVYSDNDFVRIEGKDREVICGASQVPITLDGAAAHNIANCAWCCRADRAIGNVA